MFLPPKSLEGVVGYDKVLQRVCILHIGKTLGTQGVMEDLLARLPGTYEEKQISMNTIKRDLKIRFSKLNGYSANRLSLSQLNMRATNQEKLRAGAHSGFGRRPVCIIPPKVIEVAKEFVDQCTQTAPTDRLATCSSVVPRKRSHSHDFKSAGWVD